MAIFEPTKIAGPPANELDHQTLLAIINNLSEAVLAADSKGNVTMSNGAALDILNINTLTGRSVREVFRPIDKEGRQVDLQAMIQNSKPGFVTRDLKLLYPDGSSLNLYLSFSPVRVAFGSKARGGYVMIFRDITREKSIEDERNEFISVASHELRTPVAVVEGNVGNAMLLAERANVGDTIRQSLAAAHDQIIFLGNLINDLAMLSRAERENLALTVSQFNVAELVESLVHDYTPQAAKKSLSLKKEVDPSATTLSSSQLYVREILQNFVTNAIKYTEKGGLTIRAKATGNEIEFSVADTGYGISQSEKNKLFTKFFRSDDWRVRKSNGTGLGLYVCAKLAKLLGGAISIDSQLNKGTTAKLSVPNLKVETTSA
jgi:PAS domain S-box-containing protein